MNYTHECPYCCAACDCPSGIEVCTHIKQPECPEYSPRELSFYEGVDA